MFLCSTHTNCDFRVFVDGFLRLFSFFRLSLHSLFTVKLASCDFHKYVHHCHCEWFTQSFSHFGRCQSATRQPRRVTRWSQKWHSRSANDKFAGAIHKNPCHSTYRISFVNELPECASVLRSLTLSHCTQRTTTNGIDIRWSWC